jgi:hypothetical protein
MTDHCDKEGAAMKTKERLPVGWIGLYRLAVAGISMKITEDLLVLVVTLLVLLPAFESESAEVALSSDSSLNGGVALGGTLSNSGGDGSAGNPWLYSFTAAGGGLDLGAWKIYTDNGQSFKLDLNGEVVTATSGSLRTTRSGTTGGISITNAGNITLGSINVKATAQADVGAVVIAHRGALSVGNVDASRNYVDPPGTLGGVRFNGDSGTATGSKGAFLSGYIDATGSRAGGHGGISILGYTTVTVSGTNASGKAISTLAIRNGTAGAITIGADSTSDRVGTVTLRGSIDATISGSDPTYTPQGDVSMYSSGDVLVQDAAGTVPYDIVTASVGQDVIPGKVTIKHHGQLVFNDIDTRSGAGNASTGSRTITLNGDGWDEGVAGGLKGRDILCSSSTFRQPGMNVQVSGYDSVVLRNIVTSCSSANNAGNITICAAGKIVMGSVDCNSASATRGTLSVTTSGMAEIVVGNLDLSKVLSAVFTAGGRHTVITNQLPNFPVTNAANGKLDATTNQVIHYSLAIAENAYLTNGYSGIFTLKSGGMLTWEPVPKKGTIVFLR